MLRLVRPEDKVLMRAAWERLSPESRYRRFLSQKAVLSEGELAYLTEVDQLNHVAIGAETDDPTHPEALGVARFVRSKDSPTTAEASVVVIDASQGRGLGTELLHRLGAAARERGITHFTCEVLASNATIREILMKLAPEAIRSYGVDTVQYEFDIPEAPPVAPPTPGPMRQLMGLVARGLAGLSRKSGV